MKKFISQIHKNAAENRKFFEAYFRKMQQNWQVRIENLEITFTPDPQKSPVQNIMEILMAFDFFLQKKGIKAIFIIDEFQEILKTKEHRLIEGMLKQIMIQQLCIIMYMRSMVTPHPKTLLSLLHSGPQILAAI